MLFKLIHLTKSRKILDTGFNSSSRLLYIFSFSFSNIQCNFLFSTIKGAGDGVFLKKDAPKNTIVAFFNGIHITLEDTLRYEDMKKSVHKMWNDWDR